MRSAKHWIVCGTAGFMMLSLTGARLDAQTVRQQTATPPEHIAGVETYKAHCAVCHGPEAKGNGPAAAALKKVPADLTTIAKRNGGKFSAPDVEAMIMGQQPPAPPAAHGSRDMPIWGPVFQAITDDTAIRKLLVSNLVDYLKSIQTQ